MLDNIYKSILTKLVIIANIGLLDASEMGVPQRRERVFFVCLRKDLAEPFLYQKDMFTVNPKLELNFNEEPILFKEVKEKNSTERQLKGDALRLWNKRRKGDIDLDVVSTREGRPNYMFNHKFLYDEKVSNTIIGNDTCCLFDEARYRSKRELALCGSYPLDYDFGKLKPEYLIGMSVPPVMTGKIAKEIYNQWLKKIK